MQLTDNDVKFLEQLQRTSNNNRESIRTGATKQSLITSKGYLSQNLLGLFEVEPLSLGGWFFDVYVEFEAMFKEQQAKDWQ